MVVLYIENPQGSVKKPEFKEHEITIGRADDNTIVLPERNISRHHLRIYLDGDDWMIADAGSRYGVEYKEEPLEKPEKLIPNAYIRIGDYRIKLSSASGREVAEKEPVADMFSPEDGQRTATAEYIPTRQEKVIEDLDSDEVLQEEPEKKSKKGIFVLVALVVLVAGGYLIFAGKGTNRNTLDKKSPKLADNQALTKKAVVPAKKAIRKEPVAVSKKITTIKKDVVVAQPAKQDAVEKKAVAVKTSPKSTVNETKPVAKKAEPPKKAPEIVVKKASLAPKPPAPKPVVKKHKRVATVRQIRPRKVVKKTANPMVKKIPAEEKSNEVDAMLTQARHAPGSTRVSKLRQCLQKYGNRCCRAHKYMAAYYQGQADIQHSIAQWRKYKSCASSAREKNRAGRMLNQLQGL